MQLFCGRGMGILFAANHLAFAVTGYAMRVDGENVSVVVSQGATKFAEHDLHGLCLGNGMEFEQMVYGVVADDERQAVGDFESLLTEGSLLPLSGEAKGGFMHELQGDPGFDVRGLAVGPSLEQVPSSQAQMFWDKEPDADHVTHDFITEQLSDMGFQAAGISRFRALSVLGSLTVNGFRWRGRERQMKFFFAARTP